MGNQYPGIIMVDESTGVSGVPPDSYWRDRWLAEDSSRTKAEWGAMREREHAEARVRAEVERLALLDEYRRRVPQMSAWTNGQIQAVIDASHDLLGLDY